MKKTSVFNHVSIDGMFAGPKGEIDWFQAVHDDEWQRYAQQHADLSRSTLMFGHTTYEMMKGFWPTPQALQMDPKMADVMNNSPKIVFSKKLKSAKDEPNWKNVRVFPRMDMEELKALKKKEDLTILGSGTIVQQLAKLGLIDEYALVVVPIVLGKGRPLFEGVDQTNLKLIEEKAFGSGVILLRYQTH